MTSVFDDDWSVDCGDPEVGIFGDTFVHDACEAEYGTNGGTTFETSMFGKPDSTGHVKTRVDVTCHDCGATASFEDVTFVGFEDEPVTRRWSTAFSERPPGNIYHVPEGSFDE